MPLLADPRGTARRRSTSSATGRRSAGRTSSSEERRAGFFIGSAIAYKLGCGFVPARRPGKLPLETISPEYALEYGKNALEYFEIRAVQPEVSAGRPLSHDPHRL